MPIAQLSIDLVAKIADFEKDLKRATTATQQQTAAMGKAFDFVKGAAVGMASALSVGFAVNFVKQTIDGVDALNDLRDATGASIENISALEDIAARTGTTMDTVSTAMVKFNGVLKDAKPENDAGKALKALNLDIEELKRLDPAEALLQTATAFAGFADNGNKARIMQELFGKSLKDVAPFLKDLAEKGELVAKVTTAQAEEAEKFNKQLFEMQKNVQDLSRQIAGPLVKAFNDFIDKEKEAKKEGKFGLFTSMQDVADARRSKNLTGSWGDATGFAGRGNVFPEFVKPDIGDPNLGGDGKDKTTIKHKAEKIDQESRALDAYIDGLKRTLDANDKLTEQEKALNFLRSIGATGEIAQVRELVTGMAEQIDKEKSLAEAMQARRNAAIAEGDAVAKANEEYQALLTRLYAATPTVQLDTKRKDVRALTDEFEAGRISEQLYLEAVSARLDLVADKTDNAKTAADEFGMTMASAFEDAVVGGKELSAVMDALGQDIMRMTIRKTVTDPLSGFISAGLNSFLPSFAVGTDYVPHDMVAQIHKGERIVPAAQNKQGMGQALTVVQNFTVGDVASISMVRQAVANSQRQIAAAMSRNMTYGMGSMG